MITDKEIIWGIKWSKQRIFTVHLIGVHPDRGDIAGDQIGGAKRGIQRVVDEGVAETGVQGIEKRRRRQGRVVRRRGGGAEDADGAVGMGISGAVTREERSMFRNWHGSCECGRNEEVGNISESVVEVNV